MFTKTIETEKVIISSSPQRVWNILTNFEEYGEWNEFITSVTLKGGEKLKVGDRLDITVKVPDGGLNSFSPIVLKANPAQELRWEGSLPIPGLFRGQHYFLLTQADTSNATTTLVHGEVFRGLLVPLLGSMLEKTRKGFIIMNNGLKRRAETT